MHVNLSDLDLWVIVAYLGGISVLGLYASRKVKSAKEFFIGNRAFGKAVMIGQALGTGTHSDQAVGVAGAAYTGGLSGIWYQWMWLFTTPFYWLLAPVFRRLRVLTTAEFFELRYGRPYAVIYAVFCLYLLALWQGIAIKGTSVTVSAITGLPEWWIGVTVCIIFMIYGIAGGLVAAAVTDFVQGFFIIFLSFLVLPFGFAKVGGFAGLHRALDPSFFTIFSPAGGELTPFNVTMLVISGLAGIIAQPHMMAVASTGKTEMNCRIGWTYGNFLKRFCTIGWTLTGLLAAVLYPGLPFHDRERAFGLVVIGVLPSGFVGLMTASLMATMMATCSAFMIDGAALFTEDIYKPLVSSNRDEKHYLRVARASSLGITIAGFVLGNTMPSVISATVEFISILPFIGVTFWIGIIWPRANRYGAWTSTIGSAVVFFGAKLYGISNAWASLASLVFGIISIVGVSCVTAPERKDKLDRIFRYLEVPVGEEHLLPVKGETV
ncbi:MAG: sodium:solute symporter family protein [Edaphobacter sp.]